MYYPDDVVENVRLHNNIVNTVSSYVKLEKKGKYMFGLCPFHAEKTPSFSVDAERQTFYCYSCSKGGDVFKFIMDIENIDFTEAVKKLAAMGHVELPESSDKRTVERNRLRSRLIEMNTEAARFYYNTLTSGGGKIGLGYFQKRRISDNIIRKFGLGYAPSEWDSLYRYLRNKGFTEDEQTKGGLALKSKTGGYYDRFRGRVVFPIFDVSGKVIAFGGRVIDDSFPKYINSPETPIFNKGKNLYGLNFAKKSKTKKFILVEGYLDVITLHTHGIDSAVAPLGTAFTKSQAELLKYYSNDLVIAFDADGAGKSAAVKSIDILSRLDVSLSVLTIPSGKDPDSFVNAKGSHEFRKLVDEAKPVVEYRISQLKDRFDVDTVDGRIKFLEAVTTVLIGIESEIEREMYTKEVSRQYGISEKAIVAEIEKRQSLYYRGDRGNAVAGIRLGDELSLRTGVDTDMRAGYGSSARVKAGARPSTAETVSHLSEGKSVTAVTDSTDGNAGVINKDELFIVALLSLDNSLISLATEKMPLVKFEDVRVRAVAGYIYSKLMSGGEVTPAEVTRLFSNEDADSYIAVLTTDCHCENNSKALEQKTDRIDQIRYKRQMMELLEMNKRGDITDDEREGLQIKLRDVTAKLNSSPRKQVGQLRAKSGG